MSENVGKCRKMSEIVGNCQKMLQNVSQYIIDLKQGSQDPETGKCQESDPKNNLIAVLGHLRCVKIKNFLQTWWLI